MTDVWESIQKVEESVDPKVWEEQCEIILPKMKEYWDEHPHSAMETLESVAHVLPLDMAKKMVREVVLDWKNRSNYSWEAGGSADHCFLSALLLTGNGDLAEKEFISKCGNTVLDKARQPREHTKDAEEKTRLLNEYLKR